MSTQYIDAALRKAHFTQEPDGSYIGEIRGFPGRDVWATGHTREACQAALRLALQAKIAELLGKGQGHRLPTIEGLRPAGDVPRG
jgi:hypothetical protein